MIKAIALYYIMGVVTSLYFIYYYRLSERTKGGFIQMHWTGSPRHDGDTTTRQVTFISPDDVVYVGEYESNLMCGDPFHDVTLNRSDKTMQN